MGIHHVVSEVKNFVLDAAHGNTPWVNVEGELLVTANAHEGTVGSEERVGEWQLLRISDKRVPVDQWHLCLKN